MALGGLARWIHRLAEISGLSRLVAHFHGKRHASPELDAGSRLLFRVRHAPAYPVFVGLLATVSAGTGLYPFGPVIVAATVFAAQRWRAVYLASCLGAALGAALCALVIQSLGLGLVDIWFPEIRQNGYWERSAFWIGQHGWLALTTIAALPVPQMPALIVSALGEMSPLAIGAALFAGKLVKYGVYIGAVKVVLAGLRRAADAVGP